MKIFFKSVCFLPLIALAVYACQASGPITDEQLAACTKIASCMGSMGADLEGVQKWCNLFVKYEASAKNSLGDVEKLRWSQLECGRDAANCSEVTNCFRATTEQMDACKNPEDYYETECLGDTSVHCASESQLNCANAGMKCYPGSLVGCGHAACDSSFTATCAGNVLTYCMRWASDTGAVVVKDCKMHDYTNYGETCGNWVDGMECIGGGEPCDTLAFKPRCDGSIIVGCSSGRISRRDCKLVHPSFTCKGVEGFASCGPSAEDCNPHDDPDVCKDGVIISTCILGKIVEIDCKNYGWRTCANTDNRLGAYCWN